MKALHVAALVVVAVTLSLSASPPAPDNAVVLVRRVPNGGIQPEVAIDASGTVHLLYFAGPPAGGDLFYVRSVDQGNTFSPPIRVNSQTGSAIATGTIRGGQIALGRGGRVHVAWNGSDTALPRSAVNPDMKRPGAPFLYARSTPDGTSFESQRNLSPRTYSIDGGGSVAADRDGRVHAVWHGNREGDERGEEQRKVWVARSDNDGATFAPESAAQEPSIGVCGCCQARALATGGGGLTVLYRAATNLKHRGIQLLTSTAAGRRFTSTQLQPWDINACPMTSMSLVMAGSRTLAAWETAGQVHFSAVGEPSVPPTIVSPSGAPAGRKHPRLAAAGGDTLLAWTEKTGWARGGTVAWQIFDRDGRPKGEVAAAPSLPAWSFAAVAPRGQSGFVLFY